MLYGFFLAWLWLFVIIITIITPQHVRFSSMYLYAIAWNLDGIPSIVIVDWLQCIGQSDEAIRGFKLNMLLYELLSLLYSRFVSEVRRPELVRSGRNITMQIIGYMTSHRKQHLEATDVAREFGYGREHFCRLFRKATGKTFKEFLTDLRLDDACRKLSGSSASIASIARECGFPDTRALQTAVQRKYGIRAQEYRERYENRN